MGLVIEKMDFIMNSIRKIINESEFPESVRQQMITQIEDGLRKGLEKGLEGFSREYGTYAFLFNQSDIINNYNFWIANGEDFKQYQISWNRGYILFKFKTNSPSIVEEGELDTFDSINMIDEDAKSITVGQLLKRFQLFDKMVSKTDPTRDEIIFNAIVSYAGCKFKRFNERLAISEECQVSGSNNVYCYEVEDIERDSIIVSFWIDKDFKAGLSLAKNLTFGEIPEEIMSAVRKKIKIAKENGVDISAIPIELQPQQAQGLSTIKSSNNTGETPAAPGEDGSEHDI